MRYPAIIHLIVIFIAFQTMFYGVSYLVGNIYSVITMLIGDPAGFSLLSGAPLYFFSGLLSLLLGFILLIKSHSITGFLTEKAGYEDRLYVSGNATQLLSMFILFLALSSLLTYVPIFLNNIYLAFIARIGSVNLYKESQQPVDWVTLILHLLLPCLMIVYCRELTSYFAKNLAMAGDIIITQDADDDDKITDDNATDNQKNEL